MTIPFLAGCPAALRRTGLLVAALALLIVSAAPLRAQDAKNTGADPVVATVNGTEIHQSELALTEQEIGQIPPMSEAAKKDYLVQILTTMILVTEAAEAKKIDDSAEFKQKMELARRKLLMDDLLASVAKEAVTDAAMQKVYDEAVTKLPDEQETQVRHILFRADADDEKAGKAAEDKAKAVIARLNKGEDFATLANELTEDPSGKSKGGDLGYLGEAQLKQLVPEFTKAALALDKGKTSAPVKTQFGWHVIKVEDKRTKPKPTFEQVKPQIQQFVANRAQAELIQKLRAEAKIEKMYTVEEPKKDEPAATPEKK